MLSFRFIKRNFAFKFLIIFSITSWLLTLKFESINYKSKTVKVQRVAIGNDVIINFLNKIDAFFINIKLLNEIKDDSMREYTLDYLLNRTDGNLIFGVKESFIDELNPSILKNYGIKCEIDLLYGKYIDQQVLTNVYMDCKNMSIHFAIFHERGEYYWIGDDDSVGDKNKNLWFGDIPRAMNFFNLKKLNDIKVPSDINQFLYDYKHSKFIECNKKLAKKNLILMGYDYQNDEKKENDFIFGLKYLKDFLEKNRKNYWLAAGTLLGWYRECGLIPHTTDVDIAMWNYDYDKSFKNYFLKDDNLKLGMILGLIKEGYELRLLSKTLKTFDLFLMYKVNETHQWNGYHTNRRLNKQWLPAFNETNLCSGELLNNKFIVPCNPEYYLSKQYGEINWKVPLKIKYFNYDSIKYAREWSDEEWPYVIRRYNMITRKLDVNRTLEAINAHLKIPLTQIPFIIKIMKTNNK